MTENHHFYGKTKTNNDIGKICCECGARLGHANKKGLCRRCRGRLVLCFIGAKASGDIYREARKTKKGYLSTAIGIYLSTYRKTPLSITRFHPGNVSHE